MEITGTPNVPLLRALWSLLDGIWGVLKGSWEVLVVELQFLNGNPVVEASSDDSSSETSARRCSRKRKRTAAFGIYGAVYWVAGCQNDGPSLGVHIEEDIDLDVCVYIYICRYSFIKLWSPFYSMAPSN